MKTNKKSAQDQNPLLKKKHFEDQLKNLENQLKRALADYQNLERRVEEERKLFSQVSQAVIIKKFLPVLDNLENAQAHLNDQGLSIVIKQFKDVLTQEQVEEIAAEASQFDPKLHEATEVVEGPDEGKIAKVVRKGYKINDKVLRPTQVVVTRKKVDQQAIDREDFDGESFDPELKTEGLSRTAQGFDSE